MPSSMKRKNPSEDETNAPPQALRRSKRTKLDRQAASKLSFEPDVRKPPLEKASPKATPSDGYTRDTNYYFDDGDVVLIVAKTLFRVHAEKLQVLGGMFADMIDITHPRAVPCIDGTPYCDLHEMVSPRETLFLIMFAYDDILLSGKAVHSMDVDFIHWEASITLLRVSHKYNLLGVRRAVISALECLFPMSATPRPFIPVLAGIKNDKDRELFTRQFPIEAINAFRECDLPAMLPMAYYHAAQMPVDDILGGTIERDGISQSFSKADIATILRGRDELKTSRRTVLYAWLARKMGHGQMRQGSPTCFNNPLKGGDTCIQFMMRMFFDFHNAGFFEKQPNALDSLSSAAMGALFDHLCDRCWIHIQKEIRESRELVWTKLPIMFGYTGWDDVLKAQENADAGWEEY